MKFSIAQKWKIFLCLFHFEFRREPFAWYLHFETVCSNSTANYWLKCLDAQTGLRHYAVLSNYHYSQATTHALPKFTLNTITKVEICTPEEDITHKHANKTFYGTCKHL